MSNSPNNDQRIALLRRIAIDLYPEFVPEESTEAGIVKFLALVEQWNKKIDLTAARTEQEFLDLFLADALVLHRARLELGGSDHWLDVGTGAGAPGLVLALLDRSLRVDLVEPNAKRVAFLRHSIGSLGLQRVTVHAKRLESVTHLAAPDVVSRATLSPSEWLEGGLRLTRRRLWFLLGRESWAFDSKYVAAYDRSYTWPLTGATRRVLALIPPSPTA